MFFSLLCQNTGVHEEYKQCRLTKALLTSILSMVKSMLVIGSYVGNTSLKVFICLLICLAWRWGIYLMDQKTCSIESGIFIGLFSFKDGQV